jgi:hypothetical protein
MRRRKLRWAVAGLTVALLAAGAFLLWPRPQMATSENFRRIPLHATRREVEAILGAPTCQYAGSPRIGRGPGPMYQPRVASRRHPGVGRRQVYLFFEFRRRRPRGGRRL